MTGVRRRILVVEDDAETARQLVESLATNGYQVDLAANGSDALSRGHSADYAVMTIDRMLPDIDGISVMQHLRGDGIITPVLILSALGEIDDRVRGLRAVVMIISSSRSPSRNYWRVSKLSPDAAPRSSGKRSCASVISRWISCHER
jgi:CheY-like chemotaxis protein